MNNKTFCIAPWTHTCINAQGNLTPCCQWKDKSSYHFTEFDQWINSSELKQTRENLHNGVKISACGKCWYDESIGKKSLRKTYNAEFSKDFDFGKIKNSWTVDNTITTFDFKLGNLCNLKCIMCSGNASSQLMTEYKQNQKEFDGIPMFEAPNISTVFDWPNSAEFKTFLNRFKNQITWIKFTGGEPTVVPYIIDVLETIPNPESVTVSLTTNATKVDQRLLNILSKFKIVWLSVSLEGIEEANDQIRYLSQWESVEKNILNLSQLPNIYFNIQHVFQCFSVQTTIPLLQWCDKHKFKLELLPLDYPEYLSINSVNVGAIEKFKQQLTHLTLTNNQHIIEQILRILENYSYNSTLHQQRTEYLTLIDKIRKTTLVSMI